jgi:hypothetical protein
MCPCGTGCSAVSGEGENSTNTLKKCTKTAAKITVRQSSELDEFQHMCSSIWHFTRIVLAPPDQARASTTGVHSCVGFPLRWSVCRSILHSTFQRGCLYHVPERQYL